MRQGWLGTGWWGKRLRPDPLLHIQALLVIHGEPGPVA